MLKVIYLFPTSADREKVDDFIDTYVVAPVKSSPGYRSLTMNTEPLMSPFGPPPYYRVVEATLESMDDFIAIGRSELIQSSRDHTPEGFQLVFYEFTD